MASTVDLGRSALLWASADEVERKSAELRRQALVADLSVVMLIRITVGFLY